MLVCWAFIQKPLRQLMAVLGGLFCRPPEASPGGSWGQARLLGVSLARGRSWEGPPEPLLGGSWGALGGSWTALGALLTALGRLLRRSWRLRGQSERERQILTTVRTKYREAEKSS